MNVSETKNTSSGTEHDIGNLVYLHYVFQCNYDNTNQVDFTTNSTVTLDSAVTFETNGSAVSWAVVNSAAGTIKFVDIPVAFNETSVNIKFTAYNNESQSATGTINVSLNNYAPYALIDPPTSLSYSVTDNVQTLDVSTMFSDYESDPMTYTIPDDLTPYTAISFDGDKTINIDPSASTMSATVINVTATDSKGASFTSNFTLTITNQAPAVVTTPSPLTAYDNISFSETLTFSDYFSDSDGHTLIFTTSGEPSFVSSTSTSTDVTFTGNATSSNIGNSYVITISASDQYDSVSLSYTINVVENEPPQAPMAEFNITVYEGNSSITNVPSFTDAESDSITYTCEIQGTSDN